VVQTPASGDRHAAGYADPTDPLYYSPPCGGSSPSDMPAIKFISSIYFVTQDELLYENDAQAHFKEANEFAIRALCCMLLHHPLVASRSQ